MNGYELLHRMVRQEVSSDKRSGEVQEFEKYAQTYENKVSYLEDPYFLGEWYGFMYFKNESERTFRLEKQVSGCVGYKVINGGFQAGAKLAVFTLAAGEDRTFLLKRTQETCRFIPGGKVLPPSAEDDE